MNAVRLLPSAVCVPGTVSVPIGAAVDQRYAHSATTHELLAVVVIAGAVIVFVPDVTMFGATIAADAADVPRYTSMSPGKRPLPDAVNVAELPGSPDARSLMNTDVASEVPA